MESKLLLHCKNWDSIKLKDQRCSYYMLVTKIQLHCTKTKKVLHRVHFWYKLLKIEVNKLVNVYCPAVIPCNADNSEVLWCPHYQVTAQFVCNVKLSLDLVIIVSVFFQMQLPSHHF